MTTEVTLARGLKDVVLDTTESSFIDGELGILLYRGYSIHDLAAKSNFEEVSFLLLHGKLPTRSELAAFHQRLVANHTQPVNTPLPRCGRVRSSHLQGDPGHRIRQFERR